MKVAALALAVFAAGTGRAWAQAAVPAAHTGSVTFVSQVIDHVGRLLDNGVHVSCCATRNVGLDVEVEYSLTDRWSISGGFPYVFAKYTGGPPPPVFPYPAADACHCLHHGWQDVGLSTRYSLIDHAHVFLLTPSVSIGVPSHRYNYVGEAVIGFDLKEMSIGVDVAQRLDAIAPGLTLQGRYTYSVVQSVLDISHNRSNAGLEADLSLTRHVSVRGMLGWQRTHGGLRIPLPDQVGGPDDDLTLFPDRLVEFHRLVRDNYLQLGGGASVAWKNWELSGSFLTAVKGTDSHLVRIFTVDLNWLFDRS